MSESKTNWSSIISGTELTQVRLKRNKDYIVSKERRAALPELINEGWVEFKQYKDTRFVGVRKAKKFDEIFEDQVWCLFERLGFTSLNSDRHFEMSYDYQNPDLTQQIDIFAADDETVIIIECKAAEKVKDGNFKKPLEALHGQMPGLRREAQKHFPNAKVKLFGQLKTIFFQPLIKIE